MVLLNEAQLALYNDNLEQHIISIVGKFGHLQVPPTYENREIIMEGEKIEKRNKTSQTSESVAQDEHISDGSYEPDFVDEIVLRPEECLEPRLLTDDDDFGEPIEGNPIFGIGVLDMCNRSKFYEDAIDNRGHCFINLCDYVCNAVYELMELTEEDYDTKHLIAWVLKYLKRECYEDLMFPRRKDRSKDWKLSPSQLLKADKECVISFFDNKERKEYHVGCILTKADFAKKGNRHSNSTKLYDLIDLIFEVLKEYYLDALDSKAYKKETVDSEYKALLEQFISKRNEQLRGLGFSEELVYELIKREYRFFESRAILKTKPLPECYLLDQFEDDEFYALFGFDKLAVKYLAVLLDIPKIVTWEIITPQMDGEYKKDIKVKFNDPVAALIMCLARLSSSAPLLIMAKLLDISPDIIDDVSNNVISFIDESFSHLLNINNCNYNNRYLQLLVDKSSICIPGLKQFTTHMIHGTYTKISKPEQHPNSIWGISTIRRTVRLQLVTDCLGMFIDVPPAALGEKRDRSLFKSSEIAKRSSDLKYKDTNFYCVGDSAYVSGKLVDNEDTNFSKCDDENGWNIYGVTKSDTSISKIRCLIERPFNVRNSLFKPLDTKYRRKLSLSEVSSQNMVTAIFTNIHQILYVTSCSQPFSDVLPIDFYLLMWGALSNREPLSADF